MTNTATTPEPSEPTADVLSAATEPGAPSPEANPESDACIAVIRAGIANDAGEPARAAARDACRSLLSALGEPASEADQPIPPPVAPAATSSPIAAIVATLKSLPPDQLLDLAIQRLRAALPPGTTVAPPSPMRFQLVQVPLPPAGGQR